MDRLSARREPPTRLHHLRGRPADCQEPELQPVAATPTGGELIARLRAESKRKDVFLAVVAHELRNCMAPLASALDLLAARAEEPKRTAPAVLIAQRQLQTMSRLVQDLLDVARVLRDQVELAPERCSVQELVRDVVQSCRPQVEGQGRRLSLLMTDEPLHVRVDRVRFWQILSNLLDNAAKFSKVHGRITVRASREGAMARISVSDHGAGIVAEDLGRIFDLFRQEKRTSGGRQGLGIGLALVHRLVELHGGTVGAESAGADQGATFTIRLPVAAACGPARQDSKAVANTLKVMNESLEPPEPPAAQDRLTCEERACWKTLTEPGLDAVEAVKAYAAWKAAAERCRAVWPNAAC